MSLGVPAITETALSAERVKEPNMMIIGVDYHPSFQTIAFLIKEIGEV